MAKGEIRTTFWPMALRGVGGRCPRCGGEGWFTGWFTGWSKRGDRCRTCGYRYERQDGFLLGAMTMNVILTFGLIAIALTVGCIITYPDIAAFPILGTCVAIAVIVPIVFHRPSYTLWAAVDLTMRPLEPAEEADAAAAIASGLATGSVVRPHD